jgi:flagellar biogenesis protein FliO
LSHPRFKPALALLVLCAGFAVTAGRVDAQSQGGDAYAAPQRGNSRAVARQPVPSDNLQTATPAIDTAHAAHHKTWKELAREHNQEKVHEAASPGTTPSSGDEKSRDSRGRGASLSPWTAVGALAVVISLILILARIFRRHTPLFGQSVPNEALEILGRRFLDQRQSIVLLRVGSRILVVGSSPSGLQGIGEVSDPIEVDLIAGLCRGNRSGSGLSSTFLGLLKGQASPMKAAPRPPQRRAEARAADAELPEGTAPSRPLDPDHELVRRLRAESNPAQLHARSAEVFR